MEDASQQDGQSSDDDVFLVVIVAKNDVTDGRLLINQVPTTEWWMDRGACDALQSEGTQLDGICRLRLVGLRTLGDIQQGHDAVHPTQLDAGVAAIIRQQSKKDLHLVNLFGNVSLLSVLLEQIHGLAHRR